ncbi:MAG: ABC transporter ATP-binding protein/permease [Ezakiella sp.]|nr:ABC transporter ATP-binding protein/permease [Ezakiella sp.]
MDIKNGFKAMTYFLKRMPLLTILYFALNIITGLIPIATALIIGRLVDRAIIIVREAQAISAIIPYVILLIGVYMTDQIVPVLYDYLKKELAIAVEDVTNKELIAKHAKLSYWQLEDPESLNHIRLVSTNTTNKMLKFLDGFNGVLRGLVNIVSILITISIYIWWAVPVLILFVIPLIWIVTRSSKKVYEQEKSLQKTERVLDMYSEMMSSKDYYKERTLFGYTKSISSRFKKLTLEKFKLEFKLMIRVFAQIKLSAIAVTLVLLVMGYMILRSTLHGNMSFGLFTSLFAMIFILSQDIGWQFSGAIDSTVTGVEFFKDYFKFFEFEEEEDSYLRENLSFNELEFRDVHFTYPKTEREIIKGMSFKIKSGRHYALVGENGSGKSTVVKLMLGLYDNYTGDILIDGIDVKNMPLDKRRAYFSTIFQDYSIFATSVKENILMENKEDRLNELIDELNLDFINKLPVGLDTEIGKLDERGADLSGGERQRIAIARTLISPAPVIVMDEPTAAMDPITESNLYRNLSKVLSGKTTIFISHRLGSTALSDEILLFKDGKVHENGTHDELMELNGVYREMYDSQKEWYQ